MNILALIPARMGSSRFPGKPMAEILGKPMIGHVYDRVKQNNYMNKVVVATCDNVIYEYIKSIDGYAMMTSDKHERASDRCSEALLKIEKEDKIRYDIVVMVQGDEPMVHPDMISEAVEPLIDDPEILITNLLGRIKNEEEFHDINTIKVVCDNNKNALYFSREPIPTHSFNNLSMGKQVPIMPFRRDFLIKYNELKPTPLEIAESVDMLRILEHGINIIMVPTSYETYAVDTLEDLKKVQSYMKTFPL